MACILNAFYMVCIIYSPNERLQPFRSDMFRIMQAYHTQPHTHTCNGYNHRSTSIQSHKNVHLFNQPLKWCASIVCYNWKPLAWISYSFFPNQPSPSVFIMVIKTNNLLPHSICFILCNNIWINEVYILHCKGYTNRQPGFSFTMIYFSLTLYAVDDFMATIFCIW